MWSKAQLSVPVLIYPDYTLPFKLTTDASKTGLGAVLSQGQGHGDQTVAFASKVNSLTVAKYSISELECLAVHPVGRLHRWALTLQEYDFDIQYRPGKETHVADALSQSPVAEEENSNVRRDEIEEPGIGKGSDATGVESVPIGRVP
ncbi:unnamed protein product [Phytophthora fragariaefolia]|uniref:Unnamed protein product n=1 Tax=Phytophthora fragariaefolia TaxID=1490495 RepID=A0A9W7D7I4_9STRA|nr:unnamed protein product [Phytophthora fragariaefolia]